MALRIDNLEIEQLAADVAALTNTSPSEAIRVALLERKARLLAARCTQTRSERAAPVLRQLRALLPPHAVDRRLTRQEEDDILGYGPRGV